MSTPPIQYSGPVISPAVDWEVRRHLQLIYQKLGNHAQGFELLNQKVGTATPATPGTGTFTGVLGAQSGGTGSQNLTPNSLLVGNGPSPLMTVPSSKINYVLTDNGAGSPPSFQKAAYSEPLTDGNSNFIFAAGDIIVVTGLRA